MVYTAASKDVCVNTSLTMDNGAQIPKTVRRPPLDKQIVLSYN